MFIWPCVAVWSFDRLVRLGRIVSLNLPELMATATYSPEANIVRVSLPTRRLLRPRPGMYYYVYLLRGFKLWESHPFTLKSWDDIPSNDGLKQRRELSFIFRPQTGFTARFRDYLQHRTEQGSSRSELSVRIAVEGPYGTPYDVSRCSSILFIIGGSGITVALSHLQFLSELFRQAKKTHNTTTPLSIRLVWSVRSRALFEDVNKQDLSKYFTTSSCSEQCQLRMDVHITRESTTIAQRQVSSDSKEVSLKNLSPCNPKDIILQASDICGLGKSAAVARMVDATGDVHIHSHRPAVHDLIFECAEEWQARQARMAVICCGPGGMVDDARAAIVAAVSRGYNEIEFRPEMFNW